MRKRILYLFIIFLLLCIVFTYATKTCYTAIGPLGDCPQPIFYYELVLSPVVAIMLSVVTEGVLRLLKNKLNY